MPGLNDKKMFFKQIKSDKKDFSQDVLMSKKDFLKTAEKTDKKLGL